MLTTVAKRIQSRLSRAGVKVTLGEVKHQCELTITDIENPTETELLAVQDYFTSNATQLTVIDNGIDTGIDNLSIHDIDNLDNLDNLDSENAIATKDDQDYPEQSRYGELTTTPKGDLVTTTADQMGIVLDAREISLIAENINDSADTLEQDIDAIKSAIMAFVEHKALVNQSKINEMINDVREVVGAKNQENSRLLSDGLHSINQDIQQANKDFKSSVSKALAAFAVPALKAG
jgi:hypothetical protein